MMMGEKGVEGREVGGCFFESAAGGRRCMIWTRMGRLLFDSGVEDGNALGSPSVVVTQARSSRSWVPLC
ncbi:hypothetical protein N7465_006631 [Penicillium sp. CMV-2018d]|nr:hypothetical protein N7465_006631 [Penicillium sp. CMV-2018d]